MLRPQLILCFAIITIFISFVAVKSDEKKFAPSYCLRFKLNCQNEQKKKHVCCLYPLPEGDQTGEEGEAGEGDAASAGIGNSGSVKIRPIRLPQREKSGSGDSTADSERQNEPAKRPTSNFKPPTPSAVSNRLNINKEKSTPAPSSTSAQSPKRPRICIRLVVNCNSSPEHRCCKYDDEEVEEEVVPKKDVQPEEDKKSEEEQEVSAKENPTETIKVDSAEEILSSKPTEIVDDQPDIESNPPLPATTSQEKPSPELSEESSEAVFEKSTETEKPPAQESDSEHVDDPPEPVVKVEEEDESVEHEDAVEDKSLEKVEEASIIIDEEPQVSASPNPTEDAETVDGSKLTFESVLNDQVQIVKDGEPYERIPAECFTQAFDCEADPNNRCCAFH